MMAISPCPLATNITAIAYISKDLDKRRRVLINGLIYTLGRGISYFTLGLIIYFGASKFMVSKIFMVYGEKVLGPFLFIAGILMLDILPWKGFSLYTLSNRVENRFNPGNYLASLLLGMIFALAFCPYSGVLFFGMLMPLTIASPQGVLLPLIFAFSTGIPVMLIAWLLAFSLNRVGTFYNRIKLFEKWFRRVVAVIFIITGIYFIAIYLL